MRAYAELGNPRAPSLRARGLLLILALRVSRRCSWPELGRLCLTETLHEGLPPLRRECLISRLDSSPGAAGASLALNANPFAAGVEVGTVDKFQGREAAVVLFSMATSSADFMPRNADFLFSKNRLNVAISRARCLAYLICTDGLLDTRANDVEQMTLISALCSFVERVEGHEP